MVFESTKVLILAQNNTIVLIVYFYIDIVKFFMNIYGFFLIFSLLTLMVGSDKIITIPKSLMQKAVCNKSFSESRPSAVKAAKDKLSVTTCRVPP